MRWQPPPSTGPDPSPRARRDTFISASSGTSKAGGWRPAAADRNRPRRQLRGWSRCCARGDAASGRTRGRRSQSKPLARDPAARHRRDLRNARRRRGDDPPRGARGGEGISRRASRAACRGARRTGAVRAGRRGGAVQPGAARLLSHAPDDRRQSRAATAVSGDRHPHHPRAISVAPGCAASASPTIRRSSARSSHATPAGPSARRASMSRMSAR